MAYQLRSLGISRSPESLRKEIVKYLETHPLDEDGFPLNEWVPHFPSWPAYLVHMAQDHTYGDQLTLFAAANLYNVNIQIVSSLGAGGSHVFHPTSSIPITTLYLGHFAENHGEHYIAIHGPSHENNDMSVDSDLNLHVKERSDDKCHENDNEKDDDLANNVLELKEGGGQEDDNDHVSTGSAVYQGEEKKSRKMSRR